MPQVSGSDTPWYLPAFERIYLRLYAHRGDEEAELHADAVCRLLALKAGHRVLDVACGAGRHARALTRRGMRVAGVDLSQDLLDEARERSGNLPGTPNYFRCDIRHLPYVMQFEAAISMFTSLGYFEGRADDLAVLRGTQRALRPGGRFLLDYLNAIAVRKGLQPRTVEERDGLRIEMERWIDEAHSEGPRVCKRVIVHYAGTGLQAADYTESVRLYSATELDGLLEEAGFLLEGDALGGFDERPFDDDSPRRIRIAGKPRR